MFKRRGPRRAIRHYASEHQLARLVSAANDDGTPDPDFADEWETFMGSIRPEDVTEFDIGETGQLDADRFRMYVLEQPADMDDADAAADPYVLVDPIRNDDRVKFDGRLWRVAERQPATRHDFAKFTLVLDRRGDDTTSAPDDSTSSDGSADDSTGGDSGGGYDDILFPEV